MGYSVIAPVGDNSRALFIGMKEFPTEHVILITPSKNLKEAKKIQKKLDEFTIKSEIIEIDGNLMEGMFKTFGNLCSIYDEERLVVNVATGDRISTCAALSAAFANGLQAFGVMDNEVMMLPIMKLSYYNELSTNKLRILKLLKSDEHISLKELSTGLKMSTSLLSYHINGNHKHKGLKELRLIDIKEKNKNVYVKLSNMGALILKGYIKQKEE